MTEPKARSSAIPVRLFNQRAEGRPVGYEATKAAIQEQGWTWFVLRDYGDDRDAEFMWICPGCGGGSLGTLGSEPVGGWESPRWVMEGEPGEPTLTPSLGCPRWRDGTCEGHWWLREGVLIRA